MTKKKNHNRVPTVGIPPCSARAGIITWRLVKLQRIHEQNGTRHAALRISTSPRAARGRGKIVQIKNFFVRAFPE
jgi:hypothetical protein